MTTTQAFPFLARFCQNEKGKIREYHYFWGFQSPEVRKHKKEKKRERLPDSYICFQSNIK
jgi:hypothetical protein